MLFFLYLSDCRDEKCLTAEFLLCIQVLPQPVYLIFLCLQLLFSHLPICLQVISMCFGLLLCLCKSLHMFVQNVTRIMLNHHFCYLYRYHIVLYFLFRYARLFLQVGFYIYGIFFLPCLCCFGCY